VIKVEDPRDGGGVTRHFGPYFARDLRESAQSLFFQAINRTRGASASISGMPPADGLAWEAMMMARSRIVAAAARYRLSTFDVPFLALRDEAGLATEALRVRAPGFTAKLAIHPAQVPPILAAFAPAREVVDAARGIVTAFEGAGGAAIQVDGRMVDAPLYQSAKRVLRCAGAA
jgi:citrate lyase beta subunit